MQFTQLMKSMRLAQLAGKMNVLRKNTPRLVASLEDLLVVILEYASDKGEYLGELFYNSVGK
ncbi:hypothetical protein CTZ24_15485 [Pantoea phytobeneficialis]|uniref:Uncharacterized protein n=1 Tax=Pantoea phytobeneficialis TaxID=2052056 RepID=A0AAP9H6T5_9GAMM|nr:hypothetical protein CTZ24_15485 [Pantoea phytobeneficialis]